MAKYRIKAPDGNTYEVNAPDGASQEDVLRYVQQNYKGADANANDMTSGSYWAQTAKNVPGSLMRQGEALAEAVTHPVSTFNNMSDLVAGGAANLFGIPEGPGFFDAPPGSTAKADAFANFYKEKYGSWNKFKENLKQDPMGVVGDASTAITGGAGMIPKMGAVAKIAAAADPLNMMYNAARAPIRMMGDTSIPLRMTQRAFTSTEDVGKLMLEGGYLPNSSNLEKFKVDMGDIQSQLNDIISNNPEALSAYNDIAKNKQWIKQHPNAEPFILDTAKGFVDEARKRLREADPRIAPLQEQAKLYGKGMDIFPGAVKHAQIQSGNMAQDVLIPTGVMYGATQPLEKIVPGISTALSMGAVGLGVMNKPVPAAAIARRLYNASGPIAGFFESNPLLVAAQQAVRAIGNEKQNYNLQTAFGDN